MRCVCCIGSVLVMMRCYRGQDTRHFFATLDSFNNGEEEGMGLHYCPGYRALFRGIFVVSVAFITANR